MKFLIICLNDFFFITQYHGLELRRNIVEILPTSLQELPTQLRDLRNNQNLLKTYFLEAIKNIKHRYIFFYILFKGAI